MGNCRFPFGTNRFKPGAVGMCFPKRSSAGMIIRIWETKRPSGGDYSLTDNKPDSNQEFIRGIWLQNSKVIPDVAKIDTVYCTTLFRRAFRAADNAGKMVQLERETLNSLFDELEAWERHLARLDSKSLECDHDHFTP